MKKPFAMLVVAGLAGVLPLGANGRPHRGRHPAAHVTASPMVVHLQPISYGRPDDRFSSGAGLAPRSIGPADHIPLSAANHFGRGGVASIGYEPGSGKSLVGAHELNTAFSSQPYAVGAVVGGGVSLQF